MWVFFIFSARECALRFTIVLGILAGACTARTGCTEGAGGTAGSTGAVAGTVAAGTGSMGVASLCFVGLSLGSWLSSGLGETLLSVELSLVFRPSSSSPRGYGGLSRDIWLSKRSLVLRLSPDASLSRAG